MKRVLLVTEAGDAWPSGRLRALGYRDCFAADGLEVCACSRRSPIVTRFVEQPTTIAGRLLTAPVAASVVDRVTEGVARARTRRIIHYARRADVIYLQKVASWPLVEALRAETGARLVYDLNDGLWLPSRSGFAGGMIDRILGAVDAVTCDNPFGLAYARAHNAQAFLVPDPAQVELFDARRAFVARDPSRVVLGWVGSAGTAFNLFQIWEPLERLFSRFNNITLRLLGVGSGLRRLPPFERVRYSILPYYSQADLIDEVLQMDIGLFPLFDVQDSLARGILKATVYMSGESCVVTRPIGQNTELVRDGVNGLFAQSPDEWLQRLAWAVENSAGRRRIAAAGLETVRERFTVRQCYEQLLIALHG